MTKKQFIAVATGIFFLGGALGAWVGQILPNFALRQTAQQDVMYGNALFRAADSSMAKGQGTAAQTWSDQGMGSLQVAVTPLSHLGMANANMVVPYLDQAQYDVLHHKATVKQRAVLATFNQSMAPFRRDSFGQVPESAFRSAWNRVAAKIGQ